MTIHEDHSINTPRLKNGKWTERNYTAPGLTLAASPQGDGGYDDVQIDEHGTTRYFKDGKNHRENGPAIEYKYGDGAYMLNGEFIHTPDEGELGLVLRYVNAGDQHWSNEIDGHSVEAVRHADHGLEFFQGGNRHRAGDPAVIHADGTEEWWVDGVHHQDAMPAPGTSSMDGPYMTSVGSKFEDTYVAVTVVAQRLREDLKRAQAAGVVPAAATLRVAKTSSQAIRITVRGLSDEATHIDDPRYGKVLSPKTKKMITRLQKIGAAYDKSTVDYMREVNNVWYHAFVDVETDHDANWRLKEAADAKARRVANKARDAE